MNCEEEETPRLSIIRNIPGAARIVEKRGEETQVFTASPFSFDDRLRKTEKEVSFLTQESDFLRQRIEENDRKIKEMRIKLEALLSAIN
jgi:predicted RNase H-like nuclease (RuvC/YqgF family)